jgi:hypothetical protein
MLEIFRAPLAHFIESMTRILVRSRRLMAVSILVLLAGVVVLSTATRKPCLHACTAPWHLWKAGHMTELEGQDACKLRVTSAAQAPQATSEEAPPPPPSIYFPHQETIPPPLFLVVPIRHFRSPPSLG